MLNPYRGHTVNGRQSNNPFAIPRVPATPHAPVNPPTPPRPVGNRTSTGLDQIRADEEFARRLSEQQYRESRAQPGGISSSLIEEWNMHLMTDLAILGNATSNQPVDPSGDTLQSKFWKLYLHFTSSLRY
jgi:hypothetical protein